MLRKYGHLNVLLFFLGHIVALTLAWIAAYWLRFDSGVIPILRGYPYFSLYLFLLPLILIAWLIGSRISHLYYLLSPVPS